MIYIQNTFMLRIIPEPGSLVWNMLLCHIQNGVLDTEDDLNDHITAEWL